MSTARLESAPTTNVGMGALVCWTEGRKTPHPVSPISLGNQSLVPCVLGSDPLGAITLSVGPLGTNPLGAGLTFRIQDSATHSPRRWDPQIHEVKSLLLRSGSRGITKRHSPGSSTHKGWGLGSLGLSLCLSQASPCPTPQPSLPHPSSGVQRFLPAPNLGILEETDANRGRTPPPPATPYTQQ